MNIYQLSNLPDEVIGRTSWEIRCLKLLLDNQFQTPESFVLTDIKSESDLKSAVDYYSKSGMEEVVIRSSAYDKNAASCLHVDLSNTFPGISGVDQVEMNLKNCLRVFNQKIADRPVGAFDNAKSPKLCVVVQQIIGAELYGVCFTEDPKGDEVLVIHTSDELETSSDKNENLSPAYRVLENDNRFYIENPADNAQLNNMILTLIAPEARLVHAKLGFPLRLAWALADGQLFWLQACPVISDKWLNPAEFDLAPIDPEHVFSTSLVNSLLPGAATPLTLSVVAAALDKSVRQTFVKYKLTKKAEDSPENIGTAVFDNHIFFDVSEISKIADKQPDGFKELIEISFCGEVLDESFSRCWDLTLMDLILHTGKYFNPSNTIKALDRKIASLSENFHIDLSSDSITKLAEEIDEKLETLDAAFSDFFTILSTTSFMSTALYLIFIKALMTPHKARILMLECLSDLHDVASSKIVSSLTTVARELVLDNPQVVNYREDELEETLKHVEGESKKALGRFTEQYGHYGFFPLELRSKSWQNRPADIVRYIHAILTTNLSEAAQTPLVPEYISMIENRFEAKAASNLKNLIDQMRNAVIVSDTAKSVLFRILNQLKVGYQMLGTKMAEQKLIPDADLIFFITHAELLEFVADSSSNAGKKAVNRLDLVKKAFARKSLYPAQQKLLFGKLHVGRPSPFKESSDLPKGKLLKGKCSTPGILVGKARVVYSLDDLAHFKAGEIIVTAFPDIGFSPYFNMAGALVTETGSPLAQSAIVARALSLPHITELEFATRLIKTGDTLSIDAASGEITILSS